MSSSSTGASETADGSRFGAHPGRTLALAGLVALVQVAFTFAAGVHQTERADLGIPGALLLVATAAPLPYRHRHPVAALLATFGFTLAYWSTDYPRGPVFLALVVAFGHAVLTGHRRVAIVTLVAGYLTFPWAGWVAGTDERPTLGGLVALGAWLLVIISVAETVRSRRERAEQTRRVREEALLRQATDERLRIARELHDVVAHNMSLINLQAGVALHLMEERSDVDGSNGNGADAALPDEVRHALATIKSASKEALIEMRSILGVLRQVDEDAPRAPTPGLDALPGLVERAEAAGMRVRIEADADLDGVPRNVELAAFRIVQEALTNVARHAAQADTVVRLHSRDGMLNVDVLDEGTGRVTVESFLGSGNGIPGMRERAASVGGHLEAGPRPGRGFAVHAVLPLENRPVIRVLIVDDQALLRGGLRSLFSVQADIEVVGEAGDGREAVRLAAELRPDVVLMDIRMPEMDGLAATKLITADERLDDVRIVILTTFDLDEYVFEALRSGASGFLVKDTEPAELIRALRTVAAGESLLSPRATRRLIEEFATRAKPAELAPSLELLTDREREVMRHVAAGLSNDGIAEALVISPATAKTHVSRAMIKLGARDRAQLVVFAYETGLVRPGWTD